MYKRRFKLLFVFIVFAFVGCNKKEIVGPLEEGIQQYKGKGYRIAYGPDFRLDATGKNGSAFYLFSTEKTADDFTENINLMIQNLKVVQYDLNQFIALSERQIKANGTLLESKRKRVGEQSFHVLVFEATMNGLPLKFLQYDFVKDDKAFVLTFSSKKDQFDAMRSKAEKVMDSFQFE